ncbi:MAG: cobalamin-dependent protein, partial [Deltaproteobacteria bacterium]|nr:cobalamin-dependent protein [Deltaproteobacteria bacterium]
TVAGIVNQAVQEGVDVIGLSIMSGAHVPICRKLTQLLKAEGVTDKIVVVGGVIPNRDIPVLEQMGVSGVFPGGTPFREIIRFIEENANGGFGSSKRTQMGDESPAGREGKENGRSHVRKGRKRRHPGGDPPVGH